MLPKPKFSKPILGHSADQLDWIGPIASSKKKLNLPENT